MYSIPLKDIRENGNIGIVTLRTTPTSNGQGFQTYKYLIKD